MLRQSQLLGVSSGTQVLSVSSTGGFARYSSFVNHLYWRFRQVLKFCQSQVLENSPGTKMLSVAGTGEFARYLFCQSQVLEVFSITVTCMPPPWDECTLMDVTAGEPWPLR